MDLVLYIFWGVQLFCLGLVGVIAMKNNIVFMLIVVEIMLLAVGLIFAISSFAFDDATGQLFVLFILTIAASESAIGLALIIKSYKIKEQEMISFAY